MSRRLEAGEWDVATGMRQHCPTMTWPRFARTLELLDDLQRKSTSDVRPGHVLYAAVRVAQCARTHFALVWLAGAVLDIAKRRSTTTPGSIVNLFSSAVDEKPIVQWNVRAGRVRGCPHLSWLRASGIS